MQRSLSSSESVRAHIPPVAPGVPRPLWSVMIPTYDCERFLALALERVLAQDPGPAQMQIEVVDDCSPSGDPRAIVEALGRGRVGYYRQTRNVGHIRNFETCLKRSRGHLVHLLHGDDFVLDGFYAKLGPPFELHPELGAAFCRQVYVDEEGRRTDIAPVERDESGILEDWLRRIAREQRILTPSIVVRRGVYEALGGFDRRLACAEDWEMWVRIASRYAFWYEPEPLAAYRMHSASNTGRHLATGEDIYFTRMAIDIFNAYLPRREATTLSKAARETYGLAALGTARSMLRDGDLRAALAQTREALRCRRSAPVLRGVALLAIQAAAGAFQKRPLPLCSVAARPGEQGVPPS